MTSSRLALFDCDGTLANSHALIIHALVTSFRDCGFAVPDEAAVRNIIGLSFREALQALDGNLTGEQLAQVEQRWHVHLRNARSGKGIVEPLFAGISEALGELEKRGWLMSIATGKGMHGLVHLLETNNVARRFTSLHTADECASKPAPDMVEQALRATGIAAENCIVIGDTEYDMLMARNASVKAIGVAWGYHAPELLLAAGAVAIVPEPKDLPDYLETHLPCS